MLQTLGGALMGGRGRSFCTEGSQQFAKTSTMIVILKRFGRSSRQWNLLLLGKNTSHLTGYEGRGTLACSSTCSWLIRSCLSL
jgi:hypothetical protein